MVERVRHSGAPKRALLAMVVAAGALSACVTNPMAVREGGIAFREARFAEITAMREYRACRDEALVMDEQARQGGVPARYLASARLLERCEAELGPEAANLAPEERMRAYALSIQNYLKGGDIARAQINLETFKSAFAGHDLYFADGSSFTETMEVLLGLRDRSAVGQFSVLNVDGALKGELRRANYWRHL